MKDKDDNLDMDSVLSDILLQYSGIPIAYFGQEIKVDESKLGEGIYLVLVPKDELEQYKNDSSKDYSYLYKDGKKLSEAFFRRGGVCSGFKEGYCKLIEYDPSNKKSGGIHVIIDAEGDVVLEATEPYMSRLYHIKGCIAKLDGYYYNLLTSEKIKGDSSVSSDDYIFVEHRYDYNKEFKTGVYKISFETGEYEIFEINK